MSTATSSSEWASAIDHKGRTYYYNRKTRQSSWALPVKEDTQKENFGMGEKQGSHRFESKNMYEQVFQQKPCGQDNENSVPEAQYFQKPKLNLIRKKAKKIMTPRASSHRKSHRPSSHLQDSTNVRTESQKVSEDKSESQPTSKLPPKKVPKWKQQSGRLRQAMMAARGKTPKATENSFETNAVVDDGLVPCPHCSRRFNQKAADRHIPKCQDIKAKPRTLRKGAGHPAGVARPSTAPLSTQGPKKEKPAVHAKDWHVGPHDPNEIVAQPPLPSVKRRQRSAASRNRKSVSDPTRAGLNKPTMECPTCGRSFNRRAGLRHIEKCKHIKAKPKPIRRSSTVKYTIGTLGLTANSKSRNSQIPKNTRGTSNSQHEKESGSSVMAWTNKAERRGEEEPGSRRTSRRAVKPQDKDSGYNFSQKWFESGSPAAVEERFDMLNNRQPSTITDTNRTIFQRPSSAHDNARSRVSSGDMGVKPVRAKSAHHNRRTRHNSNGVMTEL